MEPVLLPQGMGLKSLPPKETFPLSGKPGTCAVHTGGMGGKRGDKILAHANAATTIPFLSCHPALKLPQFSPPHTLLMRHC